MVAQKGASHRTILFEGFAHIVWHLLKKRPGEGLAAREQL